jgi:hypothetical protein
MSEVDWIDMVFIDAAGHRMPFCGTEEAGYLYHVGTCKRCGISLANWVPKAKEICAVCEGELPLGI